MEIEELIAMLPMNVTDKDGTRVLNNNQSTCSCPGLQERAQQRKALNREAYLEWLTEHTQNMSDASLERALTKSVFNNNNNDSENNLELPVPTASQMEEQVIKLSFDRWFNANRDIIPDPIYLIHLLNAMNESKQIRFLLGDFRLDEPYERFMRIKRKIQIADKLKKERRERELKCYQQGEFKTVDNNYEVNENQTDKEYLAQEHMRELIAEESNMKRAALEEKCYVRILLSRGLAPGKVIEAVENFWDTGELLISKDELENAVQIEYMMDLRRVRKMMANAEA